MRKNNDGYVIIYVVFVLVFLCAVAVTVCSVSLSNLQTQTAQTRQLQDKYAAMGEIEKKIAEICTDVSDIRGEDMTAAEVENDAKARLQNLLESSLSLKATNTYECKKDITDAYNSVSTEVEFTIIVSKAHYGYRDVLDGNGNPKEDEHGNTVKVTTYSYTVSATAQYTSFEIGGAA